jgi:hypothetical protein
VKGVTKALPEESFAHLDFRLGVFVPYSLHIATASGAIVHISHQAASESLPSIFDLAARMRGFINCATALNTGTATELPNWR